MAFKDFFLGSPKEQTQERAQSTLTNPSDELKIALGSDYSYAGPSVTEQSSLHMVAVYSCVRVLSEGVGSLPFHLYTKQQNGSRQRVLDDPRAVLLNESPNPEMTAMELWESVMGHLNLWGNSYLYKELNGAGQVQALWPLRPDLTYPYRRIEDNSLYIVTHLWNGEQKILLPDEVIHIKAFSVGDVGLSPIGVARQAIGTALAADEYAARFFANDARPGGLIQFEKPLTDEQINRVMNQWRQSHQGLSRSHLTGILTNGATWQDVSVPLKDLQFLETRQYQVREIARLFRVPGYLINELEGTSQYKTIEELGQSFVSYSLRPWLTRIEQHVKRGVFGSELDRARNLYPEFLADALLRGNTLERFQAYKIAVDAGFMQRSEIRELENLPFVAGIDDQPAPQPSNPLIQQP